jgi:hypothetical protein
MSTKMTRQHGDDFHLYAECFDYDPVTEEPNGNLWLELDGSSFSVVELGESGRMRVTVKLTPEVLEAMQRELVPEDDMYERLGLLEEATAHLLWCMENTLADQGAVHAVKKLLPRNALRRHNRRWGGE